MIWPPSILRVEIKNESHDFSLWLPLFVIWPFLLLAAVAMAPVVLALAIVLWWTRWGRPMLYSGPMFFAVFCALRGLEIDVQQRNQRVHLSFR
ncbi:MAG: hypothetical protein IH963_09125 [Chloroflexi bacterium]|nr:hypothetical protein [Chloroflexota bacterium]MCH8297418.1 hypothetical protein [Chloroflexota bacterium]MCH8801057.1 hypothetical protein [Chloroflexota bacterium]MCI0789951.1 hypothetical protein [Chloroflexota bacterium]MCI0800610.1 hypothetical protein [Chloroflexota bacterium]